MKKSFFFRLEIDKKNGSGHASRCLKLANFLNKKNNNIYFICSKKSKGNLKKFINSRFKIFQIDNFKNQKLDATQTIKIIKKKEFNLEMIFIIKDTYYLDCIWDRFIRRHLVKLIIIDDNIKKKHDCNIYINYNINNKSEIFYKNKNTKYLIGLKYLIIEKKKYFKKFNNNFLIYLGSSAQSKLLFKVAKNFTNKFFSSYKIIFLLGSFTKDKILFFKTFSENLNFQIIDKNINLPKYLSRFKYFLCSGGISMWEAISSGIFPAVIPTNINHRVILKKMHKNKNCFIINSNKKKLFEDFKQYMEITKKKNTRFSDFKGLNRIYKSINEIEKRK